MPDDPQPRLLIVDDETMLMNALRNTLRFEGYTPTGFTSPHAALEALRTQEFDLVLTDLMMPEMDGIDFLRAALEIDRNLVGIVMTGNGTIGTAVQAMQAGALDYILKPFELHAVLPVLNRALEVRRLRIENVRLQDRLLARTLELQEKNRQIEEELRMARELQMAMLPSRFPSMPPGVSPEESAVHFHSVFRPAGSVSGDFFDVLPLPDHSVGVFIGDVMGHDVRAALITTMLRALVHELSVTLSDPGALLGELNRQLCAILKRADPVMFASAFYMVIDPSRAQVRYANAGHPAPLHLRRRQSEIEPISRRGESGPALGLFAEATFPTHSAPVTEGDCVVLFTDGLFEIENASEEIFGQERLRAEIYRQRAMPSPELMDRVLAGLRTFSGEREFADDICLVAVEVNGAKARAAAS